MNFRFLDVVEVINDIQEQTTRFSCDGNLFLTRFQFSDGGGKSGTVSGRSTRRNNTETAFVRYEINMRGSEVLRFGDIVSIPSYISDMKTKLLWLVFLFLFVK